MHPRNHTLPVPSLPGTPQGYKKWARAHSAEPVPFTDMAADPEEAGVWAQWGPASLSVLGMLFHQLDRTGPPGRTPELPVFFSAGAPFPHNGEPGVQLRQDTDPLPPTSLESRGSSPEPPRITGFLLCNFSISVLPPPLPLFLSPLFFPSSPPVFTQLESVSFTKTIKLLPKTISIVTTLGCVLPNSPSPARGGLSGPRAPWPGNTSAEHPGLGLRAVALNTSRSAGSALNAVPLRAPRNGTECPEHPSALCPALVPAGISLFSWQRRQGNLKGFLLRLGPTLSFHQVG